MPFEPTTPDPRPVGEQGTPGRYDWTVGIDAALRELRGAGLALAAEVTGGGNVLVDSDFASLAAAVAATPTGGTLEVREEWTVSSPVVIDRAMRVEFAGGRVLRSSAGDGVQVAADDVTLVAPYVTGPGALSSGTSAAVRAVGTAGEPIQRLRVESPRVSGWDQYGIYLEHCHDFAVTQVDIASVAYAGVMVLSGLRGIVDGGSIRNVTQAGSFINSYGVAISHRAEQSEALAPQSRDVTVQNLTVDGVPEWEGIDTHGGINIKVLNCKVYDTNVGIAAVPGSRSGAEVHAPVGLLVSGNTVDSGRSDGSRSNGIQVAGAGTTVGTAVEYASGVVTGNTVIDHGREQGTVTNEGAGLLLFYTRGLVVSENTFVRPAVAGVQVYHTNDVLVLSENAVEDVWSDLAAFAAGIYVRSTHNSILLAGNVGARGAKTATRAAERGVYVGTGTSNRVTDLGNDFTAYTTPLHDTPNVTEQRHRAKKFGAYGVTPVVRPAALTAADASAVDATYGAEEAAVINNLRTRLGEMETRLKSLGWLS